MNLFLAVIYVFFPAALHIFLQATHGISLNISSWHTYVSQTGICLVILHRLLKKRSSQASWLLFIAFVSVLWADIVYSFTIDSPFREWIPVVYVGESGYTIFVSALLIYLVIKLRPLIKDRISAIIAFAASAAFTYVSFVYILIPYYHAEPTPPLFHIINSTLYALIQASVLGMVIPPIFRGNNQHEHIFMQSLLILCVADFALRYHSGFESGTPITWHSYVWEISMAVFFVTVLKKELVFNERDYVESYHSVRTFLTISISLGIVLFLGLLYSIGLLNVGDAFQMTNLLLVSFLVWFISNYISLKLSNQILSISNMLFRTGQQFEIGNPNKSNHFKFYLVNDFSQISEIDEILNRYNQLAYKANELLDMLMEKSKLAAIGQSTAMVAHDVRKPLASMKALLISLTKIKDDPVELNKMVSAVDRNIAHTNAMLEDILDFSRDSTALKLGEANPQGLVVSALSDVFRNHNMTRVNVIYDLKHLHTLKVDSERIIRVLANIIGNGIEAVNGKGENNSAEITVGTYEAKREGKKVIGITIADNGPGIPENILPKLFDPFFTHGKKGGTGLGLAICQRIITLHGGKIEARNRKAAGKVEGRQGGAEFVIELPAGDSPASINESELIHNSNELKVFREEEARRIDYGDTANAAEFMRINKERGRESYLLIVDDEPLFRETVRGLFSDLGPVKDHVKIVESDSAEKGLEMLAAREFDYVIADIDLGKGRLNGYDFSQHILEKYPNTHIIIHSNKRRTELDKNVREIKSDRFMGFLPKPMRADELLQFLACKTFEVDETKVSTVSEKKKILILNDDDALLFSFKILLKAPDVQIFTAANVSAALKHLADEKVDVILSDVNLGEGEPDGYEFLKSVRKTNKSVPFYMVSGYSAAEEGPKAKEFGANGYLQLPVDQKQLRDLI